MNAKSEPTHGGTAADSAGHRRGRRRRRVAVAAALLSFLAAAACGGDAGSGDDAGASDGAIDLTKRGPIEYWAGKDTSGNMRNLIDQFNREHPDGQVTFHELPDNADQQRQQMIQNDLIKNPRMAVLSMDVVWTAEFAANGRVVPLPADQFPTDGFLPATVESATYFDKLYGYPTSSDGGLLYYRKDLLDKAGLEPPTTWAEMKSACKKIRAVPANRKLDCYAGQYQKYEGLTVNFAEAVNSSGGSITDADGKPVVDSPEAEQGLSFLVNSFEDGTIPRGAITWQEEQGRQAFQDGKLIFHRNWPYVYALAMKEGGSSAVAGKFAVAPLPGLNGPGVSSLGGHNMAIARHAENKGTALDFIKFMASQEVMKSNVLATSAAPTLTSLYTDPDIVEKYPYMPILLESIQTAEPRPKVVQYGDVTLAIQDSAYLALQHQMDPADALSKLRTDLEAIIGGG
jgi:multiple sugar transport system substrate-binding protein